MRWLTREWQSGGLPDSERASRWQTYLEHRDATAIHLPPALHRLAAVEVDGALTLHQAVPDWWSVEPEKAFTLSVITGDDDHDPGEAPQRVVLQYIGNLELDGATADDVDAWLSQPDARLLYDEIEVLPGRRFEQRFLLAPDGELTVRFDSVLLVTAPADDSTRAELLARRSAASADGAPPTASSTASGAGSGPAAVADPPEGTPAPVPAVTSSNGDGPGKRSLRETLLSWLPGVRGAQR